MRTRRLLVDAFNRLVLINRQARIGVLDIVSEAGIGRSTFYEHFSGADQVRLEALAVPFAVLADAAAGTGNEQRLTMLLSHFWEFRQRARRHFTGRGGEQAQRLLVEMVECRIAGRQLASSQKLAARQLAAAAFAPLRAWLLGEAPAKVEELSVSICRAGESLTAALSRD